LISASHLDRLRHRLRLYVPAIFGIQTANAIDEYHNFRALCAVVDNLIISNYVPEESSFEALEHLAYQGIMQDEEIHQLKYRDLICGPNAGSTAPAKSGTV
jgi:hypothetical protein